MIPRIDIAALFGPASAQRDAADRSIAGAAADIGFMTVTGHPFESAAGPASRRDLLRIFDLAQAELRALWRWNFDASHANVYRGWFPLQDGYPTYKEGIDIGPDLVSGASVVDPTDPLCEATPLPREAALPGWRGGARDYYRAMASIGGAIMRSVARGLALPEDTFDAAFEGGISTLRLLRYPVRSARSFGAMERERIVVTECGTERFLVAAPHVDSGFVTLLAQDGVEGLQARAHDGSWLDVPPLPDSLAVNFGKVLERWTGGRIRATEHRVLAPGRTRFSIPFFYEPRVDAEIAPLPGVAPFEPFLYGDHLWEVTTKFVEQRGIAHLRAPRRPASSQRQED
jgi:isopenicillin N synthase-like dioxygenase